jgi:hypothetical protein
MRQLPVTMRRSEEFDGVSDPVPTVVIAMQIQGAFDHRFYCWTSAKYLRSRLRLELPQRSRSAQSSNNRFERSRVTSSLSQGGESMIGIKQLRWVPVQPRVAQPHR